MSAIVKGSLSQIARASGRSLAETFVHAKAVVIVDVSGSMGSRDARGCQSRYAVACQELALLQQQHPGAVGVIAFSGRPQFCPGGIPEYEGGGTDLAAALAFAKIADVPGMRFVVISDGEPDDEEAALVNARAYQNRIDTIYVGPESGHGRDFLYRLSQVRNGSFYAQTVDTLLPTLNQLMLTMAA